MDKLWSLFPKIKGNLRDQILINRKLGDKKSADLFFQPHLNKLVSADKLFPQIDKVTSRIKKAIINKELIYIYGDYDVDGITACAILWETLDHLGAKVLPYIPSRHSEGYGLNNEALSFLYKKGSKLVITVDCGITSLEQAEYAKKLGLDLVITDHHQPKEELPRTFATLHTTTLAGSGIAFKLATVLLREFDKEENEQFFHNLELATLGTVADMVPLVGENRIIVKNGLLTLSNTERIGLKALYNEAAIGKNIGTFEIGFIISPRLNAMGRMESALDSLRILLTRDHFRAERLALRLGQTNKQRQNSTQEALIHANTQVENKYLGSKFFVVSSDTYEEGIVGLVAGRLAEKYYRPTAVISEKTKVSKGSARSISGFNITQAIGKSSSLLLAHGGHPMAAGFSIEKSKIPEFREKMLKNAQEQLTDKDLIAQLKIDSEIEIKDIDEDLNQLLKDLEPFGIGNPEPSFLTKKLKVITIKTVGKENNHLKLILEDISGKILEAVGFNLASKKPKEGDLIDIVYNVRENFWNSRKRLEARIKDLRKSKPN